MDVPLACLITNDYHRVLETIMWISCWKAAWTTQPCWEDPYGISWRDTLPKRGTQIYWSGRWFSNNGQRNQISENFNHKIRPSSWTIFFWIFHMFFVDFWFNLGASQLPKPQILVPSSWYDRCICNIWQCPQKQKKKWNPAKINGKLGKFLCNLFRGYYRYYRIDA